MSARARVRGVFGSRGQLARTRNAPRTRYLGAAAPALRERTCAHCVRERNSCALFAFAGLRVALLSCISRSLRQASFAPAADPKDVIKILLPASCAPSFLFGAS